jgi:hypothetical protein
MPSGRRYPGCYHCCRPMRGMGLGVELPWPYTIHVDRVVGIRNWPHVSAYRVGGWMRDTVRNGRIKQRHSITLYGF